MLCEHPPQASHGVRVDVRRKAKSGVVHMWEGNDLPRTSSAESTVLQVFVGSFEKESHVSSETNEEKTQCVCVRERSCINLYFGSGTTHHVPLPFEICQAAPLWSGLLIEREISEDGSDGLPLLFSLLHPMGDLCPIISRRPSATTSSVTVSGFFTDAQLHLVGSCSCEDGNSLLLFHHATSQTHSVWEAKPAKAGETPSHIFTPHRAKHSTITPQRPLSTSAPSHFPHHTPHVAMDTPVEMVLASGRKQTEVAQHPLLSQLQKASPFPHSGGGKRGNVKVGSGRSPFISRLQSPLINKKIRAKSLSPPMLSRISPFSQTVNSNSWGTFYAEDGSLCVEPLIPQLSLHQIWEEEKGKSQHSGPASVVFCCTDLMQSTCLCYLTPATSQLWVLPCKRQVFCASMEFGRASSVSALHAAPVPSVGAVLILEPNGDLALHSGALKVCVLERQLLLSISDNCTSNDGPGVSGEGVRVGEGGEGMEVGDMGVVGIGDVKGTRFTVELSSGATMQCDLPPLYSDHDEHCSRFRAGAADSGLVVFPIVYLHDATEIVEVCLKALCEVLPRDTAHRMLASHYHSAIQSHPHSNHQSHLHQSHLHLAHFSRWLLSALAMTEEAVVDAKPPEPGKWSSWEQLQHVINGRDLLRTSIPAMQLFNTPQQQRSLPSDPPVSSDTPPLLQLYRRDAFWAIHLAYQELKLRTAETSCLPELAQLLHQLATALGGLTAYCDHYQTDFPSLFSPSLRTRRKSSPEDGSTEERMEEGGVGGGGGDHAAGLTSDSPPHIMQWLYSKLRGKEISPFPFLSACKKTVKIVQLYGLYSSAPGGHVPLSSLLSTSSSSLADSALTRWEQLLAKSSSPYERTVLCLVEEGLTRSDLDSLPVGVALPIWDSILHCQEQAPPSWPLAAYDIIGRDDIVKTMRADCSTSALCMESAEKDDGMSLDQEILKLHFPHDLRVNEVKRLLNSSQPVKIALEQKPEVSDHEFIEQQETHLLAICQRTMSLPVGRGMFTLAMAKPLPTAPLTIPSLDLTGRAPPRNSTVGLEHIEKPPDMALWAEFHNGVAAGLRIAPSISKLDSTWILFNRSSSSSTTRTPAGEDDSQRNSAHHAGLLLALGLSGHLTTLMDYELYEYLHDKHELTVIAVLLGIAAARVGSMQRSVASILSIFLPPLLPFGSADMEVSQAIQTAGLVAIGLLYMGSGNRHLSEVMLREIGHLPGPELEFAENRESYSLAAGLALGMITLGRGGDLPGMADLRIVDRLSVLISGGLKREVLTSAPPGPSHLVLEPDLVNTHVTSPAATVALGLMYLKTNDSFVASRLDAPATQYEIEHIRPDFFILRAASRGLILWDEVQPTQAWIDSNIPEIVQKHAFLSGQSGGGKPDPFLDHQTFSQTLVCISAGCCMAIGLRYAGTCSPEAHSCLMKNIKFLLSKLDSPASAEQAGKPCLEMCLNVVVLSAAMVMSGSGDLEVLRVLRRLHTRVSHLEVTYGSHMASHMALGLLFLGGCRYSLSRSNRAIASLYAALFPIFPSSSTDSRYHLQALRHFYVLAAEPRVLVTRDVETGRASSVQVCVRGGGGGGEGGGGGGGGVEEMRGRTPCILPEWSSIQEIEICSPDYWPMKLNLTGEDNNMRRVLSQSGTVFVRRKTGGFTQQLTQGSLPPSLSPDTYNTCKVKGKLKLSEDIAGNPLVNCSYKHLLSSTTEDSPWKRFLTAALLECVSEEKLPIFPSLLHLEKLSLRALSPSLPPSTTQLWQLKLAWALATRTQSKSSFRLLHLEQANVLMLRVKQALYQCSHDIGEEKADEVLQLYFMGREEEIEGEGLTKELEGLSGMGKKEREWLAATLLVYDIPPRHLLDITTQTTVPQLLMKVQALQAPPVATVRLLPLVKSQLPQPLNLPFL